MDPETSYMDLYHRTTAEAAAEIREAASMTSKENTQEAFFSTHPNGHISGYGSVLVHIRVPAAWIERDWARLDDEFELDDGEYEEHYAIRVDRLKPEHFVVDDDSSDAKTR